MFFTDLELLNFRNIQPVHLNFIDKVNLFIGNNGQGKSNILEALYLTCQGRSFRPAKTENFVNFKSENKISKIKAKAYKNNLQYDLLVKIEDNKKQIFVNEKRMSTAKLLRLFPCVMFSPESLSAVKDGPEARRQLIDEFLVTHRPENAQLLSDFRKCLRSRNKLLKDYKTEKIELTQLKSLLESLDGSYLPLATKLCVARLDALRDISEDLKRSMQQISDLENVDISVDYFISGDSARNFDQKKVYYALLNRQSELFTSEIESGMTLVGPHKHDIQFLFDKVDSRYYCSQGQQRALILSFKMAQIMYHYRVHHEYPILLLDDVLSELDFQKRTNLIEFLKDINSQIFLTSTEISYKEEFADSKLKIFTLAGGRVKRSEGQSSGKQSGRIEHSAEL